VLLRLSALHYVGGAAGEMGIIHLLEICLLVVEGWILSIVCLVQICWLNLTYLILLLRVVW